ncbi:hypothetical protein ALC62_02054 [Cyphomyrmex costatus]|uniref:Double jelly roll-like domain-containing protein n=1 Tax=Cyphomyrmex costatus TaxID=456900 RepID=A0A151INF2_9HYME|nr:hypothetical protein ALC62_02054 [Cyphomyrmex costatus]
MADILNIVGEPIFDDRIVKFEIHTYNPYANTTFGHSDEIRIPIQQQDLYTLPCESFLYIEERLTVKKREDTTPTTLGNNCIAFMFDEIRYELNSVEIDRNRNVGITSTLKNYVSLTYDKSLIALNAEWNSRSDITEGYFNFCVPLNMLLSFCEDYKRVIVNARHELILIQARNDNNCILGNSATEPKVELFKVQWRMPDLNLDFDQKKYALLFDMYARFRKAYYGIDCFETLLNVLSFIEKGPFAIIDCSQQYESVKSSIVDVRIEFDCKENVSVNTTAYCTMKLSYRYVKGFEKRQWLADILDCDNAIVETLDAHYKDVESLRNLYACNTVRCGRHTKICVLQNVFNTFNWWSQRQE